MPLNLPRERTVNESFTPFLRYGAKTGVFSTRGANGDTVDIAELVAVADLPGIKTGWLKYAQGTPPDIVWDKGGVIDKPPTQQHRRGFALKLLLPVFGVRELSSNSGGLIAAVTRLYDTYEVAAEAARGLLPVIKCTRLVPLETPIGTIYDPEFTIESWVNRPIELSAPTSMTTTTLPAVPNPKSKHDDLDDDIPF